MAGAIFTPKDGMLSKFKAFLMAKEFYWICKSLKLTHNMRDQLLRASSSVALNLAEGSGKRTRADQIRFYSIAFGSLRECQAILDLERIQNADANRIADELAAILYALCHRN